jgi:hypothetical protein
LRAKVCDSDEAVFNFTRQQMSTFEFFRVHGSPVDKSENGTSVRIHRVFNDFGSVAADQFGHIQCPTARIGIAGFGNLGNNSTWFAQTAVITKDCRRNDGRAATVRSANNPTLTIR